MDVARRQFVGSLLAAVGIGGGLTFGGQKLWRVGRRHWNQDLREKFAVKACHHTLMIDVLAVIRKQDRFPVAQMLALAQTESDGRWDAESEKGAIGVWQVMPRHAIKDGLPAADLKDPRVNCRFALRILGEMADKWSQEYHYISAYNCGWGTWEEIMAGKRNPSRETERHWTVYRGARRKYEEWIDRGIWNDDRCYA